MPVGQPGAGSRLRSLRTPIHTAEADLGTPYGTWAAGDDYKASFHDGMTFVPYLGSAYPRTQSLRWKTTSAKLGSQEILETTTPTPVQSGDWRYEYRFGALTEAYDVRAEGLEQTFVLHSMPAAGDLVIKGAVASLLRAKNVPYAHQPLVFLDEEGRAIVEYGHAVAFDAAGQRVLVDTSHADGEITLRVPAEWLARATLPVVVDPLLARVQVASWGAATDGAIEDVDIGRDDEAVTHNVMITYTRAASATDSDLWARLCDDDFANEVLAFSDITTSWVTDQTSCAFVGGANRWAVVFRRHFTGLTPSVSELRCHVHDSGDTTALTNYGSLSAAGDLNDWRPDVGGVQGFAAGNNAMVVFQREDNTATSGNFGNVALSTVFASLLDVTTANGTFGAAFELKPSATHDSERPSVNQVAEGGASFSWVCVYQRFIDGAANEDWDLNGVRIAQDGTVAAGAWISDLATVTPAQHQLGPVVEGNDGRYAVTFATVDVPSFNFKTGLISGKQIQLERFDWANGAASPSGNKPAVELRTAADRRWEPAGLAYDTDDDSHWTAGFRNILAGNYAAYGARVGYQGEITENVTLYLFVANLPVGPACVFDNDNDNVLFAYGVNDGGPLYPVYGHAMTYDPVAAPSNSGLSCSSAIVSWDGSQQIGSEFGAVEVGGAPAGAIHIMLAALATTNVPVIHPIVFPGCNLLVMAAGPSYLGAFPAAVGPSASFQLPLPEFLSPTVLYFQDWYLDANGLLYSTHRLAVPITK